MARRADTPCATCGKPLWGGSSSLPAGSRTCLDCRRSAPGYRSNTQAVARSVRCPRCGRTFETTHSAKRYCSQQCSGRARYARRQPGRRSGAPWRALRTRVLAQESHCAICGGPIDLARKFPDPMSPSVDHIVSLADGGAELDRRNVRAAHLGCNASRGASEGNRRRVLQPDPAPPPGW